MACIKFSNDDFNNLSHDYFCNNLTFNEKSLFFLSSGRGKVIENGFYDPAIYEHGVKMAKDLLDQMLKTKENNEIREAEKLKAEKKREKELMDEDQYISSDESYDEDYCKESKKDIDQRKKNYRDNICLYINTLPYLPHLVGCQVGISSEKLWVCPCSGHEISKPLWRWFPFIEAEEQKYYNNHQYLCSKKGEPFKSVTTLMKHLQERRDIRHQVTYKYVSSCISKYQHNKNVIPKKT